MNSQCVEVAGLAEGLAVRDSKRPAAGMLVLSASQARGLVARVRSGRVDL